MLQLAQGHAPSGGVIAPKDTELESGETLRIIIGLSVTRLTGSRWSAPTPVEVAVTDRLLLITFPTGEVIDLPWSAVVGFDADLTRANLVLDPGDGQRLGFRGVAVPILAVVAVARLYGPGALAVHPALRPLR